MKTAQLVPTGESPDARLADGRTRERVARALLELGPSTAAALSERLGLSAAAIRRHLDAMLAAGTITTRESRIPSRRGRGRPAKLFALTDAGHAAGPAAYDELAGSALDFLAGVAGEAALEAFARQRAEELADRLAERLPDADAEVPDLADALTAEGYAATVHPGPTGTQLCQHHCPVQAVAERFPQLCEAETAALSRLLGTHVQRLATIAHGDGVCTTHIPRESIEPPSQSGMSDPRAGVVPNEPSEDFAPRTNPTREVSS